MGRQILRQTLSGVGRLVSDCCVFGYECLDVSSSIVPIYTLPQTSTRLR